MPVSLGGPPVGCGSLVTYVSMSVCLVLLCVCGVRPAHPREAGSSSDSRQPALVSPSAGFTPLLYPSLADTGRGREKLLSAGCCSFTLSTARSHSPPLPLWLSSSYLPPSPSLSLPLLLGSFFMPQTHTCTHTLDPKASLK